MQAVQSTPIAILGAGSWGTALALYLSRLGQEVRLWSYRPEDINLMRTERVNNRFLPNHPFPDTLFPTAHLAEAISGVKDILIAVPSVGFVDMLTKLKPLLTDQNRIFWVTKGLDASSGKLLHDVALDILGNSYPLGILAGPSFAKEIAAGLPAAVVIASEDKQFANDVITRFNSKLFRVYSSDDVIGVEIGGIVKNVLAIAAGISDGMGLGANARSAMITRGIAEMVRLGTAIGGRMETFSGLTGLGDLILTCTDNQSRNKRFGLALGQGKSPEEAEREIGQVVEGKKNANSLMQLAKKYQVEMPISEAVWKVLHNELTSKAAMESLLSREPKQEN